MFFVWVAAPSVAMLGYQQLQYGGVFINQGGFDFFAKSESSQHPMTCRLEPACVPVSPSPRFTSHHCACSLTAHTWPSSVAHPPLLIFI